jgi:hypothetical protein
MKIKLYEEFSDNLSLSDFLYLNLKDAELYMNYNKSSIEIRQVNLQDFVDEYIETANRNGQWSGGPLNSEWGNKWYEFFGLKSPSRDKPTIDLKLIFEDNSTFTIGFSLITKESVKYNWEGSSGIGEKFHVSLNGKKFGKYWGSYSYDDYYDILHRILPEYKFDWKI